MTAHSRRLQRGWSRFSRSHILPRKRAQPLRAFAKPIVDQFQAMPYRVLQTMMDWWAEPRKQHYWRSGFLDELPQSALEVMTKFGVNKPMKRSGFGMEFLHGAAARVPIESTAFAHRRARYNFLLLGSWDDTAENEEGMHWVNEFWEGMKPYTADRVYTHTHPSHPLRIRLGCVCVASLLVEWVGAGVRIE